MNKVNQSIVDHLNSILRDCKSPNFRSALKLAIKSISAYKAELKTFEQIKDIYGCGPKIGKMVLEFIQQQQLEPNNNESYKMFDFEINFAVRTDTNSIWPEFNLNLLQDKCSNGNNHQVLNGKIKKITSSLFNIKGSVQSQESNQVYFVEIPFPEGILRRAECTCPYPNGTKMCKHIVAVIIATYSYIQKQGITNTLPVEFVNDTPPLPTPTIRHKNFPSSPPSTIVSTTPLTISPSSSPLPLSPTSPVTPTTPPTPITRSKSATKSAPKKTRAKPVSNKRKRNVDISDEEEEEEEDNVDDNDNNTSRSKKEYEPKFRSGAFGILVGLYIYSHSKNENNPTKDQIIHYASDYSDSSYTSTKGQHSAWSSIKTLVGKDLVLKHSQTYSLTQKGHNLATKLYKMRNGKSESDIGDSNDIDMVFGDEEEEVEEEEEEKDEEILKLQKEHYQLLNDWSDSDEETTRYMVEHSVIPQKKIVELLYSNTRINIDRIILLVDNREIKNEHMSKLMDQLKLQKGLEYELRMLPLGDFVWVAKVSDIENPSFQYELLLDYIVERKKLIDLANSIKDGRYKSQKFRLKRCGVDNVIYLIEGDNSESIISQDDYLKYSVQLQVQDKFTVKTTDDEIDTVKYLTQLTNFFKEEPFSYLSSCLYEDFSCQLQNLQVPLRDIFASQLLTIGQVNQSKAHIILNLYETPSKLYKAFQQEPSVERNSMLASLKYGERKNHAIGTETSTLISKLYSDTSYDT
eukprot:gene5105-6355_t